MSTEDQLNESLNKFFKSNKIYGFTYSTDLAPYKVVQFRNIKDRENPFFDKKPKCECSIKSEDRTALREARIKTSEFYAYYKLGYVAASRIVGGNLEIFKPIALTIIMDLKEKLNTFEDLIGNIRFKVEEIQNSSGYRLEVTANIGIEPNDIYFLSGTQTVEDIMKEIHYHVT